MRQTGHKEPYLNFLNFLLCISMLTEHGTKPVRRRSVVGNDGETRFDYLGGHWIVSTEEDAAGKAKRRNCKMCHLKGKADLKSVYMCEKCEVPLHTHCFKPYHTKSVRGYGAVNISFGCSSYADIFFGLRILVPKNK